MKKITLVAALLAGLGIGFEQDRVAPKHSRKLRIRSTGRGRLVYSGSQPAVRAGLEYVSMIRVLEQRKKDGMPLSRVIESKKPKPVQEKISRKRRPYGAEIELVIQTTAEGRILQKCKPAAAHRYQKLLKYRSRAFAGGAA